MNLNVLILPGDGIGAEVTREAVRVLRHVAGKWNHSLTLTEGLLGGIAIHKTGTPSSGRDRAPGRAGRCHPDGRRGSAGVRQRAARKATGKGLAGHSHRRWASTPICDRCALTHRSWIRRR